MNNQPIGIFDSGIGGLTVLKEFIKLLPNEHYIYYADTEHLPYGDKTKEQIIEYSKNIIEYFIARKVKAVIIACGTASSLAYTYLKENYKIPIFNIIEPVAKNITEKNIGVIATQGSISSHVWENEILKHTPNCQIISVACPNLVPIAEKGAINTIEAKQAIKEYLHPFKTTKIESLILGCTHYPLFSELIHNELGKNLKLINAGTYLANEFKNFSLNYNLVSSPKNKSIIEYIVSGSENNFIKNKEIILKL